MLIKLRGGQDLMHTGREYKIISHNVTTSFFICVFKFALKIRDCAEGKKTILYQRKRENYKHDLSLMFYIKMKFL